MRKMIKRTSLLVLVICLSLVMLPAVAQAQSEIRILDSWAEVEFPLSFRFNLSVESDVNITDIRLHYAVDRQSFAQVTSEVYVEFVPSAVVETSWTWDMRRTGGLPPGAAVVYWWTVEDADGNRTGTVPVQVYFDDERYSWQSRTEGEVTIYWYEGEQDFIEEIVLTVQQALTWLAEDTGAYLKERVEIFVYGSSLALRGAMIFPQEWTGGVAFTRYGTIAIGIAPYNLDWGKKALRHELTHLVIHQMTLNPYIDLPTWLDEGLAVYSEGELGLEFANSLNRAIAEDRLISVRSLSSSFSADTEQALLSYAQSYSLVEFLISNYGRDKMLELLNIFREGSSYDDALMKVYGFDMDGLDTLWRDYVTMPEPAEIVEGEGARPLPGGVLAVMTGGLTLMLGLSAKRGAWR